MYKLIVEGGNRLSGEISVHGAKNSSLPVLAASLICKGQSVIHNCPVLSDVDAAIRILRHLGCHVSREGGTVTVDTRNHDGYEIPSYLMREMRSSIVFLGAIVAKHKRARLSFPGGCELGPRPIDLHLAALRQMGVKIDEQHGYLDCRVDGSLRGAVINLALPSVGATENILLAASTAKGTTVIHNASREPEINDLAEFLNGCGANIRGAGESVILIDGVKELYGGEHRCIPDRITAATYMSMAAMTGGSLMLREVIPAHLSPVIPCFEEAGCEISTRGENLLIKAPERLRRVHTVRTMAYPGFPTDAQPPIMAMTCLADGTSMFVENIFENRYKHVSELIRLGAHIKVEGKVAVVEGVSALPSASLEATDLRGGAAITAAALAAQGVSEIEGVSHIDRGYERFEENLRSIGAKITREKSVKNV